MGSRFIVCSPSFLCFYLFFPLMGACCAQTKGFTLGLTRTSSRQPNVKPFVCAQHAPISGLWMNVFVKALPPLLCSLGRA